MIGHSGHRPLGFRWLLKWCTNGLFSVKSQAMKKVLVIGGAKSGKTRFSLTLGESLLSKGERGLYIATCLPLDNEMKEKVRLHKKERSSLWDTLDEPIRVWEAKGQHYGVFLLDCLTMWLLNVMEQAPAELEGHIERLLEWFSKTPRNIIVVTNEIGLGIVPQDSYSRRFRDLLGSLNQDMASVANDVYLVLAGIATNIKNGGMNVHRKS